MTEKKKKKFAMPSALVIVFLILIVVAALTWIVPVSSVVDNNGVSQVHYNASLDADGNLIENAGTKPAGIWDIMLAPVKGFQDAASVSFSILISGAFLGLMTFVGALDAGIGGLLKRFTGKALIAILMLAFSLMGTVYGSWDELTAYALIIIPLFVVAGYDVLTGIAVMFVGAIIGNMSSVVNPFSTGAAVAAIGNDNLSLGSGIAMRMLIFIVLYVIGTFLVIRYASKVKANKEASMVHGLDVKTLTNNSGEELPELTTRRKWSLAVFMLMILSTIFGYIPWSNFSLGDGKTMYDIVNMPFTMLSQVPIIGDLFGAGSITYFGDWYFDEFSIVFLIGSVIIAFINKVSEKDFVREFVKGCEDLLGVVLVLSIAKGIALMMGSASTGMSVTFVYWLQAMLQGVPAWAFVIVAVIIYLLIGLFLQSTSGVAGITMPILGAVAVALFTGTAIGAEGGQVMLISAFTVGLNFVVVLYPGATVMGVVELCNVPYDRYLKFMLKIMIPLLVIATAIISISPYIGLI